MENLKNVSLTVIYMSRLDMEVIASNALIKQKEFIARTVKKASTEPQTRMSVSIACATLSVRLVSSVTQLANVDANQV